MNRYISYLKWFLIFLIIISFIVVYILLYTHIYSINWSKNNNYVLEDHIIDLNLNSNKGLEYNIKQVLDWQKSFGPQDGKSPFIRSDDPKAISYFIYSKKGRCGEGSWHFVVLMDKLGFKSRVIIPKSKNSNAGHMWAEVFDYKGNRYLFEPYHYEFYLDLNSFVSVVTWNHLDVATEVIAIYVDGTEEDVTNIYMTEYNSIIND